MNILLVEDDEQIAKTLKKNFEDKGIYVVIASRGEDALNLLDNFNFDLIILDWKLPGISGLETCKIIRERKIETPIIMLTILSQIENKVKILSLGADDYITKPFEFDEVLARVQAVMRRYLSSSNIINYQELTLNLTDRTVKTHNLEIKLTDKEFELLRYLILHQGEIISKERIFNDVWKIPFNPYTNVIEVTIKNLRKKIEKATGRKIIKSIYGEGYTLLPE
ncbi:MAG: response regulator transcription factor [Ignavibacteria bacterium]